MAKKKAARPTEAVKKRQIDQYAHTDKERANNPPVGLVTPDTDPVAPAKKSYQYDPHLDPQLVWAGKAERTSFDVPTVSLHVHERIDPKSIIAAVRTNGDRVTPTVPAKKSRQLSLFEEPRENPPLRDALDFYKHPHGWTNRLIAGDSLLVMNSLLEKEGMAGKVQMIYIDPPYGIKYGSNFQPFVNKREVKDGKDEDLTQEPETLKAFRDTWELGIHSYLTYLRDRLLLARELLTESGSVFVQISDENLHRIRDILDDVFGEANFAGLIAYRTTGGQSASLLSASCDFLLWFMKNKVEGRRKFRQPTSSKSSGAGGSGQYAFVESPDGVDDPRPMTASESQDSSLLPPGYRILAHDTLYSQGAPSDPTETVFTWRGNDYRCPPNTHWKPGVKSGGMSRLANAHRFMRVGNTLRYKRYLDDYPVVKIDNVWNDTAISGFGRKKEYVVETSTKVIERCILMTTDTGDLILDPTCGSGTTAFAAEQWGRRWITCDTSRVAITLTKQRLLTSVFDYYELAHPSEGIGSGFKYKTVTHITLGSIANNPEIREGMTRKQAREVIERYAQQEPLYELPLPDKSKARVTGPFTVEAVPAVTVEAIDGEPLPPGADLSITRSGPTSRQDEWRDELGRSGVRGKGGATIEFARLEPLPGAKYLHAIGETKDKQPKLVVVSFGPEHAPLEQRQVEQAWEEARSLSPKPLILLFAAFHFDPEAAKDIDELDPKKTGMQFLKLQMNTDMLTDDLKKKRSSNESFWLVGQPDVALRKIPRGEDAGLWEVEVHGFDYYNPTNGKIESGDTSKIAVWFLDTNYDGRSLFPRQVFFPMSGEKDGWARLARNLKAEIDEELIEAYRGTVSLPFDLGSYKRVAVKIVDDRGIESLKIMRVE